MWSNCLIVLGLSLGCHAVPTDSSHVVHETRVKSPEWVKLGRVPGKSYMPVKIGLVQDNLNSGYTLLMDVSDPDSPNYSKWYTQEQVTELFQPSYQTIAKVKNWLYSENITDSRITHTKNKGWLVFPSTASEAERLFRTKFNFFKHSGTGRRSVGTNEYHLPKDLVGHIDYVTPGVRLVAPQKKHLIREAPLKQRAPKIPTFSAYKHGFNGTRDPLAYCDTEITDSCIRALYGIPLPESLYGGKVQEDNALGIFESGDMYIQENLDKYFRNFTPWIPRGTHPTAYSIDGATLETPSFDHGESDMDFILAYPIVYPQQIKLFQTDEDRYTKNYHQGQGIFNTFLDAIDGSYCTYKAFGAQGDDPAVDPVYPDPHKNGYHGKLECGTIDPTPVISISYGVVEADLPTAYQKRQCNEFMKLGLRGISVLISSGDSGVAGREGCLGGKYQIFNPSYPANCPYVTAVGATKLPQGRSIAGPEVAPYDPAINHYASGGGFSNIYPAASYQKDMVETYLRQFTPPYASYAGLEGLSRSPNGVYNRLGRGFPDVSANGDNDVVYTQGRWWISGGTSASTPIFASLINRINEQRLGAGKTTLGFLNPALYKNANMFNDIMEGSNPGCGTKGFSTAPGWDPVTGLGTPNFKMMASYFMGLP